jgi:hypothetical protein
MVDIGSLAPRGEHLHAGQVLLESGTSRLHLCCPAQVINACTPITSHILLLQMCA